MPHQASDVALLHGVLLLLLSAPAEIASEAVLTWAVSQRYLGGEVNFGAALQLVWKRLWPMIGTLLIALVVTYGLLTGALVGMVLYSHMSPDIEVLIMVGLGLPGVVVAIGAALVLKFVPSVFIVEDVRYWAAVRRSWALVEPHFGAVIGVTFLAGVIAMAVGSISEAVPGASIAGSQGMTAGMAVVVKCMLQGLLAGITTPIRLIPAVVLYFDCRVRSEGFDIALLAQEMGTPVPPPPPVEPISLG